jgi:homoserine O-succinyltransferase
MPVCLDRHDGRGNELLLTHIENACQCPDVGEDAIHVGVVNNMPDAALHSTERQFLRLLDSASEGIMVQVSFYDIPEIPRTEAGRLHVRKFYSCIEALWDSDLDGIIITGAEPRATNLVDEPYWARLTSVFEWAESKTRSAILSCLSAHAAVFHFDGIERQRFTEKRSGLFECSRITDHFLTAGTPLKFRMPHSRWNGVGETDLFRNNYLLLTRSSQAGADMFIKQLKCLLICFQGHPEYESNTLLLEYHRDVGRYLKRNVDTPPSVPIGYFDATTARELPTLRGESMIDALLINSETGSQIGASSSWFPVAKRIYANWLTHIGTSSRDNVPPLAALRCS